MRVIGGAQGRDDAQRVGILHRQVNDEQIKSRGLGDFDSPGFA